MGLLKAALALIITSAPASAAWRDEMAIRYVKDFEFPAAAGYTDSAPSKVTGPMFAKGGKVEKAPKGMMVVIGIGKPKGPMKKAEGGSANKKYVNIGGARVEDTPEAKLAHVKKTFPNVTEVTDEGNPVFDKKAKGGKVDSVPVKDIKSGKVPQSTDEDFYGKAKDMPMPTRRPATMKKGGMKHDDAAQDKAMIESMIKPSALKKAGGGMAQKVQMAKSNAIEASMKGQKKTPYADGGDVMPPRMASPLQAMAARTRSVPVAPRNPMIPQQAAMPAMQAAAPGGARIGVGRARAGKPNVGAIRAAMARSATQAMPESDPSMMKKGGKVKC